MAVAISITQRVNWLEEESQTVRPILGLADDGKIKGKIANPTVLMMPAILVADVINAVIGRRNAKKRLVAKAPTMPRIGPIHNQGHLLKFVNHAPSMRATVLFSGLDAALGSIVLVMT